MSLQLKIARLCLEEACVLLAVDTSMTEALEIMDEVKQKVALVTKGSWCCSWSAD